MGSQKARSQPSGGSVFLADPCVLDRKVAKVSTLDWLSHKIGRKVRSSYACEHIFALTPWTRSSDSRHCRRWFWFGLPVQRVRELSYKCPLSGLVTDCKSVFTHLERGMAKPPRERRDG